MHATLQDIGHGLLKLTNSLGKACVTPTRGLSDVACKFQDNCVPLESTFFLADRRSVHWLQIRAFVVRIDKYEFFELQASVEPSSIFILTSWFLARHFQTLPFHHVDAISF